MKRLTEQYNGEWVTEHAEEMDYFLIKGKAIDRLAAYEDTGLSPEEVQELAQAKAEGRLAVLPNIKLYKTLYWIWGDEIMPVKYKGVHHGCIDEGKYHVVCRMTTKKPRTFVHRKKEFAYPAGNERWFYADDIGKTVFLTREEAEKALGGETERGKEG